MPTTKETIKATTDLINANAERKVSVIYADGKHNHEATIKDISDKFISEGWQWREWFFNGLLSNKDGIITKFGTLHKLI